MQETIHAVAGRTTKEAGKRDVSQKGMVIWLYGLSGAGKSTIADQLLQLLAANGFISIQIDGDSLRAGLNNNLSFDEDGRYENIRRAAEVAKLIADNEIITVCSLITPLEIHRQLVKSIVAGRYYGIFINCPLEVCEKRDVKGLYRKARAGFIKNFTGIDAPFESSGAYDLTVSTHHESVMESAEKIFTQIIPFIQTQINNDTRPKTS